MVPAFSLLQCRIEVLLDVADRCAGMRELEERALNEMDALFRHDVPIFHNLVHQRRKKLMDDRIAGKLFERELRP